MWLLLFLVIRVNTSLHSLALNAVLFAKHILSDKEIGLNGKVIQRVWLVGSRGERSCRGVELLAIARRPGPAFLSHPVYAV